MLTNAVNGYSVEQFEAPTTVECDRNVVIYFDKKDTSKTYDLRERLLEELRFDASRIRLIHRMRINRIGGEKPIGDIDICDYHGSVKISVHTEHYQAELHYVRSTGFFCITNAGDNAVAVEFGVIYSPK